MATDTRIVYGARCTWWDHVSEVGIRNGLPVCPFCNLPLFEMEDEAEWYEGVDKYASTHEGYRAFVDWCRGRCFRDQKQAQHVYEDTTGAKVAL